MCLLVTLFDSVPGCPLVIGANREEFYSRSSQAPAKLHDSPSIWGGRDLRAGGTWLGVNQYGLVSAITNRPGQSHGRARSRGLLCLDVLAASSAGEAAKILQTLCAREVYNPFNLFVSDGKQAFLLTSEDSGTFLPLQPGLWLIPNGEVNDLSSPRVRRAQSLLADLSMTGPDAALAALQRILSDHESGVSFQDMICHHGVDRGTVSSSILAIWPARMDQSRYLHIEGKPCEKAYSDYSHLFREDFSPPREQ